MFFRVQAESWVRNIFQCCPICGEEHFDFHYGHPDWLLCLGCGAKWHIFFGFSSFKHAVLENEASDGRGRELVGKKIDNFTWAKMVSTHKTLPPPPTSQVTSTKEKEIVTQTKVIVKVKCPYCQNLYDETLDKCPHCGGKR